MSLSVIQSSWICRVLHLDDSNSAEGLEFLQNASNILEGFVSEMKGSDSQ